MRVQLATVAVLQPSLVLALWVSSLEKVTCSAMPAQRAFSARLQASQSFSSVLRELTLWETRHIASNVLRISNANTGIA